MPRNKQLERLRRLIKKNTLPNTENIDWVEVYKFWLKEKDRYKPEKTIKPKTTRELYEQRARTINCRARKKKAIGTITADDLLEIMKAAGNKCNICGKTGSLVFDHIISLYKGGTNSKDNFQALCRICNMEKGVN